MSQQSWLLKAVATELRLTTVNRQRSHTYRIVQLLLDDSSTSQGKCKFIIQSKVLITDEAFFYKNDTTWSLFHMSRTANCVCIFAYNMPVYC